MRIAEQPPVTKEAPGRDARYSAGMESRFTNYFQIGHNSCEMVIDCGCFYESEAVPSIHTRVTTTPQYAKALLETLVQALSDYEAAHGVIAGGERGQASEDR
jgi:hypothetical protein